MSIEPPASLDYDMWLGPAPQRPYNEKRLHYNWHFMKDYGTGDMGNWGAHWLDVIRWLLDLDVPKSVSAGSEAEVTKYDVCVGVPARGQLIAGSGIPLHDDLLDQC